MRIAPGAGHPAKRLVEHPAKRLCCREATGGSPPRQAGLTSGRFLLLFPNFRLMQSHDMQPQTPFAKSCLSAVRTRQISSRSSRAHCRSPLPGLFRSFETEKDPLSPISQIAKDPLPVHLAHFTQQNPVTLCILPRKLCLRLEKLPLQTLDPRPINYHDTLLNALLG